jgi:PilZ domain
MMQNVERRNEDQSRVPLALSVELGHDGFDESFEADAVDLSPGGLSLRTACLPEIGEELMCRFEATPEGTQVSSRGRVVWTQTKGQRSGEFGLRFTELDDEAKALIDELVAERKARVQALQSEALRVAELQLAGVSAPLTARLLRAGGGEAVFEQTLPLLELGRGVVARAGYVNGKGTIADVKLSLKGDTPTLAVTVRFDERRSLFGEFEWEQKPDLDVDTTPDLDAPDSGTVTEAQPTLRASTPIESARVTMVEFEASQSRAAAMPAEEVSDAGSLPAALAEAGEDDSDEIDEIIAAPTPHVVIARPVQQVLALEAKSAPAPVAPRVAPSPEQEIEQDTWAHPVPDAARSSVLVRLLRVIVAIHAAVRAGLALASKHLGPSARTAWLRTRTWFATRALPTLRSVKYLVSAKASARAVRVTTAPSAVHRVETPDRAWLKPVAIGVAAIGAIALSVYALAPSPADTSIELHRPVRVKAKQAVTQAPSVTTPSAAIPATAPAVAPATATTPAKVNAAYANAMAGQAVPPVVTATPTPKPAAVSGSVVATAAAGAIPASSPYAVDVRDPARISPAQATTAMFGQRSVPKAQRFVLRMSAPVKALQGTGDKTGFTVVAQGVSSLDKAGPITATASNVARASIWNKGGQAELTIRFAEGKSPAYRVTARGAELEILIGQ